MSLSEVQNVGGWFLWEKVLYRMMGENLNIILSGPSSSCFSEATVLQKYKELLIWKGLALFFLNVSWVTESSAFPSMRFSSQEDGKEKSLIHLKRCVVVLRFCNYQAVLLRRGSPPPGPFHGIDNLFGHYKDTWLSCEAVIFFFFVNINMEFWTWRLLSSKSDYAFFATLGSCYKLSEWTRLVPAVEILPCFTFGVTRNWSNVMCSVFRSAELKTDQKILKWEDYLYWYFYYGERKYMVLCQWDIVWLHAKSTRHDDLLLVFVQEISHWTRLRVNY